MIKVRIYVQTSLSCCELGQASPDIYINQIFVRNEKRALYMYHIVHSPLFSRNGRECEIGAGEVGGQDANLLRSYTEVNCDRSPRLNHLSPKSDQHQISPCKINALQNSVVMRIKDMITHDVFA